MSLTKTLLEGRGFIKGIPAGTVDPRYGGQFGYSTDITNYINHEPYTQGQLTCFILQYPKGFDDLNDDNLMAQTLKALMETGSKTIDGLRRTIQPEFGSTEIGGDGSIHEVLVDAKMDRSEPTHTFIDRHNGAISRFWEFYFEMFGMNPKTKAPNIITTGVKPAHMLPDYTHFIAIYIETDRTQLHVVDAYLSGHMFPKTMPQIEGRRDMNSPRSIREISIGFTSIQQTGYGVLKLAQQLVDRINYTGANPQMQPAFLDTIDSTLAAAKVGAVDLVDRMSKEAIKL